MMPFLTLVATILNDGTGPGQVNLPQVNATTNTIQLILQIVFGLIGGIAFLVFTIAAFQYTISRGEPQATARAKDTIIYAIVGIIIASLAFSIVTFVYKSV